MMKKIYSIFVCLCLLTGFVACEKDKDFALNTLAVNDEMVTPSFETAQVSCSFKADATISDAFVQYSQSSSFAKYEVAKMTEDKGKYTAQLTGLVDNTTYYIRYSVSNKYSSVVAEKVAEFKTLPCTVPTIVVDSIAGVKENQAKVHLHLTSTGGAVVTDMGICWSKQANPTTKDIHKSTDDTLAVLDVVDLQPNTQYYVRAYAMNKMGIAYSEEVVFTTLKQVVLPTVTTASVTSVTETSAVTGGNVTSDGNASVTERGVVYATTQNPTTANTKVASGSGTGSFVCNLSGLQPNTKYYVRAYAVNSKGTAYGEEITFITNKSISLPIVTTAAVTSVTETSAVTGGNVTSDGNASVTERGVVYSTNPNPVITNLSNTIRPCGSGTGEFTYTITGLQANTKYYVRAYAKNDAGTAYGEEISFTTNKQVVLPTVTTTSATSVTETSAVTGGNVTSDGNATVTERGVVYATTQNPTTANTKVASGSGTGSYTCNLSGLQPNTTYYVRAYAINSKGTAYGTQVTFTTSKSISLPTVTTTIVSSIRFNYAMTGGNVTSEGGASVTDRGVVYSTTKNPTTTSATKVASGNGVGVFTTPLENLSPNTTYYVRAYATNSAGTAYGTELTFTTSKQVVLPTINTVVITQVTTTTAIANANVTNDGGGDITERGVVYSTSQNPTTATAAKVTSGSGTGTFTTTLEGLTPSTTYYVRAYAKNSAGTAYGGQATFTTSDLPTSVTLPTVTTTAASSIKETSAVTGGNVTSDGNATVTERGIVYNTYANPTVTTATKVLIGSGKGSFTYTLTGLQSNTKYYVRAYATNEKGTAYGSEISFTTKSAESGLAKFGWEDKNDMFQDCMADCGVTGLPALDELKAAGTESFATICNKLTDVSGMMDLQKWDWLTEYIMTIQNADPNATALVAGTSSAGWRYAVAAFFLESQRTGWPRSADFSEAGKVEAFLPYIK